jgi:hypothetical protein
MRCVRCNTVFAVARRSDGLPTGYEEFVGRPSALPADFAFLQQLRESQSRVSDIPPMRVDQTIIGQYQTKNDGPEHPEDNTQAQSKRRKKTKTVPNATSGDQTIPLPLVPTQMGVEKNPPPGAQVSSSEKQDEQEKPADAETNPSLTQEERTSIPKKEPLQQTTADKPPKTQSRSEWEDEDPLDLTGFAVYNSKGRQLLGKITFFLTISFVLLILFTGYRNDWNIQLPNLFEHIVIAFSKNASEDLPDTVGKIEVIVDEHKIIKRKAYRRKKLRRGAPPKVLSVSGKVFNNNQGYRTHIVLRGRLLDSSGKVHTQTRIPCGREFRISRIKRLRKGAVHTLYTNKGVLHNCTLRGESSTPFQLLFEDVPRDFDDTYTIEVEAVSARLSK